LPKPHLAEHSDWIGNGIPADQIQIHVLVTCSGWAIFKEALYSPLYGKDGGTPWLEYDRATDSYHDLDVIPDYWINAPDLPRTLTPEQRVEQGMPAQIVRYRSRDVASADSDGPSA